MIWVSKVDIVFNKCLTPLLSKAFEAFTRLNTLSFRFTILSLFLEVLKQYIITSKQTVNLSEDWPSVFGNLIRHNRIRKTRVSWGREGGGWQRTTAQRTGSLNLFNPERCARLISRTVANSNSRAAHAQTQIIEGTTDLPIIVLYACLHEASLPATPQSVGSTIFGFYPENKITILPVYLEINRLAEPCYSRQEARSTKWCQEI